MKHALKKLLCLGAAAALSLSLLAGCSSGGGEPSPSASGSGSPAGAKSTTFTWALMSDIVSLDPIYAYDTTTNAVVNQITEGLLNFDLENNLVCSLAESWQAVDPTTYVYQVRSDVNFSDGSPMTMEDVLFSIERHMGSDSFVGWMYANVASIEQTGDWGLTVKLSQPDAMWQYAFATTAGHVVSKTYYDAHKDDFGTASGGVLGTGAYKLEHWNNGSEIVLTANENYWNGGFHFAFDKLVYPIIIEDTTRITALKSGQVNFILDVPVEMIDQLESDSNVSLQMVPSFGIDFLAFNTERAPFDDVNVRRAIAYAIDAQSICDNILPKSGDPATGLSFGESLYTVGDPAKWQETADRLDYYDYNLEKAKECLAQSAYPDGFGCTLLVSELSSFNSIALTVQNALSQLGINVSIEKHTTDEMITMEFGGTLDAEGHKDYDMGLFTWYADFPDTSGNLYPIYLGANAVSGGSNTSSIQDAELDKLLLAQNASIDANDRQDLMIQASERLVELVPTYIIDYCKIGIAQSADLAPCPINASWVWNLYAKDFGYPA